MAPGRVLLPFASIRRIEAAVDLLFDRAKVRVLGPQSVNKRIEASYISSLTLPSLFEAASREERNMVNEVVLKTLLRNAENYVESYRASAKAQVVRAVDSFLQNAARVGVETSLETVLGGQLADVWGKVTNDMHRMIDTEASNIRNTGVLDGIIKVNVSQGIEDPLIYFVVVRDIHLCLECRRLHMLKDGITPRVWKLSEIGHGYHKKGQENPKVGGLHPHCRCSPVTIVPGFGFDKAGMVAFISPNHDEYRHQHNQ